MSFTYKVGNNITDSEETGKTINNKNNGKRLLTVWDVLILIGIFTTSTFMQTTVLFYRKWQEEKINVKTEVVEKVVKQPEIKYVDNPVPCIIHDKSVSHVNLTMEDVELLARLTHGESGNQDEIGKRLVVDTVLNRVDNPLFPDTVYEVIYDDSLGVYQYAAAHRPDFLTNNEPTAGDYEAVYKELETRLDCNVYYFQTTKYHKNSMPLYQHGEHYFSGL